MCLSSHISVGIISVLPLIPSSSRVSDRIFLVFLHLIPFPAPLKIHISSPLFSYLTYMHPHTHALQSTRAKNSKVHHSTFSLYTLSSILPCIFTPTPSFPGPVYTPSQYLQRLPRASSLLVLFPPDARRGCSEPDT